MVWRYLKLQLFILVCGVIGPIYLIGYFAFVSQADRHSFLWMFWAGLLITVADVLIAVVITRYWAKSAAKTAALEESGALALAQITGMQGTGMEINDQPVVKLDLHIAGPGFAFDSRKRVTVGVTRTGIINARKLVVLVNPATNEHEVDWERSAFVNGLMPVQFTLSGDNRTYDLSGQAEPLMEILQILKANKIPLTNPLDLRSAARTCATNCRTWCAGRPRLSLPRHSPPDQWLSPTRRDSHRQRPPQPGACRNWPGSMRMRRSPTTNMPSDAGRSSRRSERAARAAREQSACPGKAPAA